MAPLAPKAPTSDSAAEVPKAQEPLASQAIVTMFPLPSSAAPLTPSNGCAIFPRACAYPERIVWCHLSPAIIAGARLCLWHSRARREEDEPDRWGPPVGEPAQAASGATRLIRFPSGGSVFPVSTSPLLWKRILSRCVFFFLVLLKQDFD